FGERRAASVAAWKSQILKGYDQEKNALFTEALYRYPGVFNDLCPHSKADLSRGRGDSAFTRLRQPVGWDPDQDYLGWLMRLDPHDASTRLKIWGREIQRIAQ